MNAGRTHTPDLAEFDMRDRWTPTETQDAEASRRLRNHARNLKEGHVLPTPAERNGRSAQVWTVQLLVGKERGLWDLDVTVHAVGGGVHWSRHEAYAACDAAVAVHRMLRPDVPVSASYTAHTLPAGGALHGVKPRPAGLEPWTTNWTVHEISG